MKPYRITTAPNGVQLLQFNHFLDAGLIAHGLTTRNGGVSQAPYSSLNMGRKTVDHPDAVKENQMRVAQALGLIPGSFVYSDQVHETDIIPIGEDGPFELSAPADGLATQSKGITLTTFYADCMAILLYDPVLKAIGMAHGGWRGTVGLIGPKLVAQMGAWYGSKPSNLLAALGPAIGPCCFEVGPSVAEAFELVSKVRGIHSGIVSDSPLKIDLGRFNEDLLVSSGIPAASIVNCQLCTCCHPDWFFSHRRDHGTTGRMAAVMALSGQ